MPLLGHVHVRGREWLVRSGDQSTDREYLPGTEDTLFESSACGLAGRVGSGRPASLRTGRQRSLGVSHCTLRDSVGVVWPDRDSTTISEVGRGQSRDRLRPNAQGIRVSGVTVIVAVAGLCRIRRAGNR